VRNHSNAICSVVIMSAPVLLAACGGGSASSASHLSSRNKLVCAQAAAPISAMEKALESSLSSNGSQGDAQTAIEDVFAVGTAAGAQSAAATGSLSSQLSTLNSHVVPLEKAFENDDPNGPDMIVRFGRDAQAVYRSCTGHEWVSNS